MRVVQAHRAAEAGSDGSRVSSPMAVSTADSPSPDLAFAHMLVGVGGMGAAFALLAIWPGALASRWHPATLAAVHLFAVGGLAPVMFGALFQFVPVASGLALPQWRRADPVLLAAMPAGASGMAAGFLTGDMAWLSIGAGLGLSALLISAGRLAFVLVRCQQRTPIVFALYVALLGLLGALACAAVLIVGLANRTTGPSIALIDWHALWAVAGWVGGLVLAVAGMVVPMFHVTDAYPPAWGRWARSLPLWLLAGSLGGWLGWAWLVGPSRFALAATALAFGVLTMQRLLRSRRKALDAFRIGWFGVALGVIVTASLGVIAHSTNDTRWGLAFGAAGLVGFAGLGVNTMLYRIVPFLIWLHWQRRNKARVRLPLLHEIIPAAAQRPQMWIHAAGVLLLIAAPFAPELARSAALLLLISELTLVLLLIQAMRLYRKNVHQLDLMPARQQSHP